MTEYRHYGKVTASAQLAFNNYSQFENELKILSGKEFEIIIRERFIPASTDQHGYYRGGVIREALNHEDFGGWSEDDVHDYYAEKFLTFSIHRILAGKVIEYAIIESTAHLGKKRFAVYIQQVIDDLWNEHQIEVGAPEDYVIGKYQTRNIPQNDRTKKDAETMSDKKQ